MTDTPVTLVEYTDDDGDLLTIAHDPLPDEREDVWIGINMQDGRSAAVRIPRHTLILALVEPLP